ncbi:DNA-directed RNA polymerase II subunit Rpb4-like [Contarinia nasturtii]|uniref:DNA-directed RNA polymerase II subunit Rpb4-like n=1 Tax=Contarinia nasturtii TaxID=265458 RepID=UPI0012D4A365|nr:DNA-directed RNA polymerase II subunit Rpb4-like [Contarinia nasturtii]
MSHVPIEVAEEDAADLIFPEEFKNAEALMISEVFTLLDKRKKENESRDEELDLSEVFLKTITYTDLFRKFKNVETMVAVRSLLNQMKLHKFELAVLGNLCPDAPEEAKALIPTLDRFTDEEVQVLLDDIGTKRSLQY